jgi:hypothetical protein
MPDAQYLERLGAALFDEALDLLDVIFGLRIPFEAARGHVADLAQDGTLLLASVVVAVDPGDVGVGVRVAAVHEVLVV